LILLVIISDLVVQLNLMSSILRENIPSWSCFIVWQ